MDEKSLIILAKKGDLDAFNQLVIEYQNLAFTVAYRMVNDPSTAEDVCQEAFIKAYQKIKLFKGESIKSWLMRIVTNTAIDFIRKTKRNQEIPLYPQDEKEDLIENVDWLIDENLTPEEHSIQSYLNQAIQNCINSLPPEFRAVLILIDVNTMDYKEASQTLQIPLGTIKSRLLRARKKIQACLLALGELLPESFRLNNERID
jgi:RNA polymerase sigma-70 factor (ECF subfamily)